MQVLRPILDRSVSTIDDVIAVMTAIDAALPKGAGVRWWQLKSVPPLQRDFFDRLDRFTGFSAQALLARYALRAPGSR